MTVARLGEAGKWHVVRVMTVLADRVFTLCKNELRPIVSPLRKVNIEIKEGEPTCKHCIRLRVGEVL